MSSFSTRNSDGASGRGESCNTVRDKDWKGIQDRALKANPALRDMFSEESIAGRIRGRDNYNKRHQN